MLGLSGRETACASGTNGLVARSPEVIALTPMKLPHLNLEGAEARAVREVEEPTIAVVLTSAIRQTGARVNSTTC